MSDIVIKTEDDLTNAMAYSEKITGVKPNKEMLDVLQKAKAIHVRCAYQADEIVGMRCFTRVINPFIGSMGLSLVHDLSGGHDIEPESQA